MGIFSALFGIGKRWDERPGRGSATAQLNHLIGPLDRADLYEIPLNEALEAKNLGSSLEGGTMMAASGEIEFIDVEISLTNLKDGVPFVLETLEKLGAPKGSILRIYDKKPWTEIPFGKMEGIGIYLDGANLPPQVYQECDVNVVIEELNRRIEGIGEMQGHWHGPTETALYFYGTSADQMRGQMADFLESYPLCQGARVVTIAPPQAEVSP